ncbi:sigma-B regulation protein RsbU (phosphoserine phosphatase) [Bacillus ectoiniformans]|uniref:SpoIIE family protein phosphatase n=1 Tax=Bacillus ectoiniformans TaxID=1494429 RepID=UPI00195F0B6E|nr:SpoIIE family protein phosphatase [Bacillus ectoiniformans]MBM7647907.1 sigma-B regulation protein RsbU (phosphoserine phosphatase) [Bacillus ectoiniformans]
MAVILFSKNESLLDKIEEMACNVNVRAIYKAREFSELEFILSRSLTGLNKDESNKKSEYEIDFIVIDLEDHVDKVMEFRNDIKRHPYFHEVPMIFLNTRNDSLNNFVLGADHLVNGSLHRDEIINKMKMARRQSRLTRKLREDTNVLNYLKYSTHATMLVIILDSRGRIIYANDRFCQISGYSFEELSDKDFQVTNKGVYSESYYMRVYQTLKNGEIWNSQWKHIGKKGHVFWTDTNILPLADEYGREVYVSFSLDITTQKEREMQLDSQLELAQKIQETLMPVSFVNEQISFRHFYKASKKLSGDLCAWYQAGSNRYNVILIDVMGHGVPSSLITMGIRSLLPGLMTRVSNPIKIMDRLERFVNEMRNSDTLTPFYFTGICMTIDFETKQIHYVNAGHPQALLSVDEEIYELSSDYFPAGLVQQDYKLKSFSFNAPGKVVMYTDGLFENAGITIAEGILKLKESMSNRAISIISELKEEWAQSEDHLLDDICIVEIDLFDQ